MHKSKYHVIGLMSGSSLDGVDLAAVEFTHNQVEWSFSLKAAACYPYSEEWRLRLEKSYHASDGFRRELDKAYGSYLATLIRQFAWENNFQPDLIASHGHTVFHQPEAGKTLQIGSGEQMARETGFLVVNDFRSEDVAKGGQGAPLVPIGDRLLFADFNACLNLGGIANISFEQQNKRIAFDICIANQALNYLAKKAGHPFDENGAIAASGKLDMHLLRQLDKADFFSLPAPKSLGREFFEKHHLTLIEGNHVHVADAMHTYCHHIAAQIAKSADALEVGKILVTGGGAHNSFLINTLKRQTKHEIVIPHASVIDFKEAIVFAFLGLLKSLDQINVLASATGASSDSSSGIIWQPHS